MRAIKVAAYCRVSTDKDDQANSFESQQRYFYDYIHRQPDWELYQIYADEGITGTSTKRRIAFNRMIQDARLHRFSLILTKEVSRFSRNILDTISYTRNLRSWGVGVQFMNDGINTLEPDSELRLSIMGSIAQEESRKTSSRVKWGQSRRMEQGVVFGHSMLGYDVHNGKMTVNPQGAEIVRLIFHKYVYEGKGTTVIARELEKASYKTLTGSTVWRNTVILKILKNEKYCGDLKQKKTITPDYLTHQKKYNQGEEEFIFLKNHHEPIVERELWEKAQREIVRRNIRGKCPGGHGNRYPLSGKIKCGECGRSFVSRSRKHSDGSHSRVWRCGTLSAEGKSHVDSQGNMKGCDIGYQISDKIGLELVKRCVDTLELEQETVINEMTSLILKATQFSQENEQAHWEQLHKEQLETQARKTAALDAFFAKTISQEDLALINCTYDQRLANVSAKLSRIEIPCCDDKWKQTIQESVTEIVCGKNTPGNFYGYLLDRITAFPNRHLDVKLKCLPGCWSFALDRSLSTGSP